MPVGGRLPPASPGAVELPALETGDTADYSCGFSHRRAWGSVPLQALLWLRPQEKEGREGLARRGQG